MCDDHENNRLWRSNKPNTIFIVVSSHGFCEPLYARPGWFVAPSRMAGRSMLDDVGHIPRTLYQKNRTLCISPFSLDTHLVEAISLLKQVTYVRKRPVTQRSCRTQEQAELKGRSDPACLPKSGKGKNDQTYFPISRAEQEGKE